MPGNHAVQAPCLEKFYRLPGGRVVRNLIGRRHNKRGPASLDTERGSDEKNLECHERNAETPQKVVRVSGDHGTEDGDKVNGEEEAVNPRDPFDAPDPGNGGDVGHKDPLAIKSG